MVLTPQKQIELDKDTIIKQAVDIFNANVEDVLQSGNACIKELYCEHVAALFEFSRVEEHSISLGFYLNVDGKKFDANITGKLGSLKLKTEINKMLNGFCRGNENEIDDDSLER